MDTDLLQELAEDIASSLKDSHNVLTADVREGRYRGGRYVYVTLADDREAILAVDPA